MEDVHPAPASADCDGPRCWTANSADGRYERIHCDAPGPHCRYRGVVRSSRPEATARHHVARNLSFLVVRFSDTELN